MDWHELTDLTRGQPFIVERVRLTDSGIAVEGEFEPPQFAQLSPDDQVFIAAFVRSHGSIKEMERIFGVSYPTVKARLNRIAGQPRLRRHRPRAHRRRRHRPAQARRDQRPGGAGRTEAVPMIPQLVTIRLPPTRRTPPAALDPGPTGRPAPVAPAAARRPRRRDRVPHLRACARSPALRGIGQVLCALPGTRFEMQQGRDGRARKRQIIREEKHHERGTPPDPGDAGREQDHHRRGRTAARRRSDANCPNPDPDPRPARRPNPSTCA